MKAQDLKKAILQYAMQGKLVEQDPTDESASELLKRIKAEKEQLLKDGKIKKEKPLPPIAKDEIPYELPQGWEWVRLGSILIKLTDGTHYTPKYVSFGVPFLSVKDMSSGKLDFSNTKFVSEIEHKELFKRCNPEKGDLLVTKVGTTGVPVIVDTDIEFSLFVSVALMKFNQSLVDVQYLYHLIYSPLLSEQAKNNTKGVGNKNWVLDKIAKSIIPLPPLEEQKRIVEKLEQILPLVDEYAKNETQLTELNKTLPKKLRQSILQHAVQGKLVEQDPTDEPASELLKRIKAEKEQLIKDGKIKKEKPLPPIAKDEIPYELPQGWEWVRLQEVLNIICAGGDKPQNFTQNETEKNIYPVIANGEKNNGILGYSDKPTILQRSITVSGRGTMGFVCIREANYIPIVRLLVLIPNENINMVYLKYLLTFLSENGTGTAVKQLTVPMLCPKVIPLPPLEEQKRIVAKIEELTQFCDKLEG
ncbi:MAG: restriction endonuclease subunit S [Candidatus Gastranaerophilales bacterium]